MARASAQDLAADSMVNLNQASTGCDFQIRILSGPECDRLRSLGFCEKMRVRKLMGGRNLVCTVCGSRMALSSKLAEQVMVSPA